MFVVSISKTTTSHVTSSLWYPKLEIRSGTSWQVNEVQWQGAGPQHRQPVARLQGQGCCDIWMSVRQQATPIARLRLSYWSSSHPTASLFVRHTFRFQFKNNNVDCRSKTRQVRDWNTSASFDAAMIVLLSFSCPHLPPTPQSAHRPDSAFLQFYGVW